jgi:hypothetical protein
MKIKNLHVVLSISVLIIFISVFFGEKVPLNNGHGWDGEIYFQIAKNTSFTEFFDGKTISKYYIKRALPFLIVGKISGFCSIDLDLVMKITSFLSILISMYFVVKIMDILMFKTNQKVLTIICLFCNYSILKMIGYYPWLTDQFAFLLTIVSIYYFLRGSNLGLIMCIILMSFVWPVVLFMYLMLLSLNCKTELSDKQLRRIPLPKFRFCNFLWTKKLAIIMSLSVSFIRVYITWQYPRNIYLKRLIFTEFYPFLGLVANILFYTFITYHFVRIVQIWIRKFQIKFGFSRNVYLRIILIFLIWIVVNIVQTSLCNPEIPDAATPFNFVTGVLLVISNLPADIWVSLIPYFGIVFVLFFINFIKIRKEILKFNFLSFTAFMLFFVFFMNGEQRGNIMIFPLLTFWIISILSNEILENLSQSKLYLIFFGTLLISRFYVFLNRSQFVQVIKTYGGRDFDQIYYFNNSFVQRYFMYWSHWMNFNGWLFMLITSLFGFTFVYIVLFWSKVKINSRDLVNRHFRSLY